MIETAYSIDNQPSVVRYPRASGYGEEMLMVGGNALLGHAANSSAVVYREK